MSLESGTPEFTCGPDPASWMTLGSLSESRFFLLYCRGNYVHSQVVFLEHNKYYL